MTECALVANRRSNETDKVCGSRLAKETDKQTENGTFTRI